MVRTAKARHCCLASAHRMVAVLALVLPVVVGTALPALAQTPPPPYQTALGVTTVNGAVLGAALFSTCASGANGLGSPSNQAFQSDCNLIVSNSSAGQTSQALASLAADQINAQNSGASRAAGLGVAMIQGRLERLRLASTGSSRQSGDRLAAHGHTVQWTGGGASGDLAFGRFGGFLQFDYGTGEEDATPFQPGYDLDRWAVLGGLDYRFSDNLIGGLAVRYHDMDVDYDADRGDMTGNGWAITAFGTYFLPNGFFVDGLAGYGQHDYNLDRLVRYTVSGQEASQIAKSEPRGHLWNLHLGAGYTLSQGSWSITPTLRLNYLQNEIDRVRERMVGSTVTGRSMALAIDSETYTSFTSNLGVQIANAISHRTGVIVPQLRMSWIHEFENDQKRVGATFINDINQQPLFVVTNEPDRNYFDLAVAVSAQFAQGRSAFVAYNTLLGYDDVTFHAISAGVRLEF
ncbi:autotransporter outer membrane beta-barrel domain-containing protein [Thioalkalicoccus limnaeus]|uniref:Autotransporter outer membrane beta-barrel domain-containing protein n=1 Tax=Thioalkalicoccus limnaeus TaxID=120681 RepID=A0ABV4BC93_9GAMM